MTDPSQFKPGSLVLTKIKGFPPWPSMILPDNLAPSTILNKKPKAGLTSSRVKKEAKRLAKLSPEEALVLSSVHLVKFFHDDTYQWTYGLELAPLAKGQVALLKPKRASKALERAFAVAENAPEMEEFAAYGSYGKPSLVVDEEEAADEKSSGNEDVQKEEAEVELELELEDNDDEAKTGDAESKNRATKKSAQKPKQTAADKKKKPAEKNGKKRKSVAADPKKQAKKPKKEYVDVDAEYEQDQASSQHLVIDVDDDVQDSDPEDIKLAPDAFKKEEAEIEALEKKYQAFVSDLQWESGGAPPKKGSKRVLAKDLAVLVKHQSDYLLEARRSLSQEALKTAVDFDVAAVQDAAETLDRRTRTRAPALAVANRVRIGPVLLALLKRSDLHGAGWNAARGVLLGVYTRVFAQGHKPAVPEPQEGYVV